MYTGAKTAVRTVYGNSNCFEENVGMHQGTQSFAICDCYGSFIMGVVVMLMT